MGFVAKGAEPRGERGARMMVVSVLQCWEGTRSPGARIKDRRGAKPLALG